MSTRKKRIAVVSRDFDVADFFAWEARACGCPVEVFSAPPEELSAFDLLILDVRVGICLVGESGCTLALVMTDERQTAVQANLVWQWPVALREVRKAMEGLCETAEDARAVPSTEKRESEQKLYLLSEQDRTLLYRNRTLTLTEREWTVLCRLGKDAGDIVSREELQTCLGVGERTSLNVHVCHLRQKLEEPFGIRLIETVRGGGYRLKIAMEQWK